MTILKMFFQINKFKFLILCLLFLVFLNLFESKSSGPSWSSDYDDVDDDSNKLSKVSIKGKWFLDEYGRVLIFHGINAVKKSYPWIPNDPKIDMTNKTQLLNLKKWGFNTVRLGMMWSGLMPEKDFINETYLNEMVNIVDNLGSLGIYVIIDLHQDMMSSKFSSYDGVPRWLVDQMPNSKFNFPWPLQNKTLNYSLFSAYITESCGFAFQCLYNDVNNFGYYFQQFWSIIAKTFVNNTAVLGYELINEPWAGDVYADPLLLLPYFAGRLNLLPFYDKTYETIRSYDSDTLVFYEPVTWGVMLNRNYFGTGFDRPPGNDTKKTVLSWHYYCWFLDLSLNPIVNGKYPKMDKVICDEIQLKASFEAVKLDMIGLGGGASFLTEFGVCAFPYEDNNKNKNELLNTDECQAVLNANDKYLESWTYWDSYFYYDDDKKEINYQLVDIFSRVYPRATNGIPQTLNYNSTNGDFTYLYLTDINKMNQLNLPTEIFIPEHVYPNGFYVQLSEHLNWIYQKENNILLVYLSDLIQKEFQLNLRKDLKIESKIQIRPIS